MPSIFTYKSYKPFIIDYIDGNARLKRGGRLRLSETVNCQPAFISQVLNGSLHFSMEQAEAASRFMGLSFLEKKFFLNLVQLEKAGTSELKYFLREENQKLKAESAVLAERLNVGNTLSTEEQSIYYSKWYYSAIHVLITIENFNSQEQIATRLGLSLQTVREALTFLERVNFIERQEKGFSSGKARLHLSSQSPLVFQHHMNWRLKALEALADPLPEDLHYSSVVSISKRDAEFIKEELIKKIEHLKKVIRKSPEEELYSLSFDFFQV
jgi:uncharacterized protein (TIGR02147 family)